MTVPTEILDELDEVERGLLLGQPYIVPADLSKFGDGANYAIYVYRGDVVSWCTPWVPYSGILKRYILPLTSHTAGVNRVTLVRRVYLAGPVGPYTTLQQRLNFTLKSGVLNLFLSSLSSASSSLGRRAQTFILKVPRRQFFSTSGRPNPETYTSLFGWFDANELFAETGTDVLDRYSRSWSGVRTPGYHSLKRRQLPENPHHVVINNSIDNGLYEYQRYSPGGQFNVHYHPYADYLGGGIGDDEPDISNADARNLAVKRLADKSNVGVNNLAETVSTVGQLNRMISNNVLKIVRSYRALRAGNFTAAANYLYAPQRTRAPYRNKPSKAKSLADNWLELQYGWKPLLKDIEFVVDTVSRLKVTDTFVVSTKASATKRHRSVLHFTQLDNWTGQTFSAGTGFIEQVITSKFGIKYSVADQLKSLMAQSGFLNPISLAWELLPFSFVVDWFLPIGPYLEGFTQWQGLQFRGGYEISFRRKTMAFAVDYHRTYTNGPDSVAWGRGGSYYKESIVFDRSPLSGFPSQSVPSFKNPFTVSHALNAVALLKSVFGR